MFAKLLKHEIKSVAAVLGMLCLGCLGIGVVGGVILRYLVYTPSWKIGDLLEALLPLILAFMFLALIVFAVGGWIYLCINFYKRKFTDEGYLTFTLPVSAWQIYLSSFLNFLLWYILIGLAVVGSLGCVLFIGFVDADIWNDLFVEADFAEFWEIIDEVGLFNSTYAFIQFITGILVVMNCITVGAVMAKKHKALAAFAAYYLVSMVTSVVSTVVSVVTYAIDPIQVLHNMQLVNMLISCILGLGGAVLSVQLMTKKLNLP